MHIDSVVDAAEGIVRSSGFGRLTIRNLASTLDESKSHVEQAIGSMPVLIDALEERAAKELHNSLTAVAAAERDERFVSLVMGQPEWVRMAAVRRSGPHRCTFAVLMFADWPEAADYRDHYRVVFDEFVRQSTGAVVELIQSLSIEMALLPELSADLNRALVEVSHQMFRLQRTVEAFMLNAATLPPVELAAYSPTSAVAESATTRDHVIHAATVLVKRHGLADVSIRDIAEGANCGKSTAQSIVGNRIGLVDLLRASARVDFLEALSGPGATGSALDRNLYLSRVVDYLHSDYHWAMLAVDRGSAWATEVTKIRPGFAGDGTFVAPTESVGAADFVARWTGNAFRVSAVLGKPEATELLDFTLAAVMDAVAALDRY